MTTTVGGFRKSVDELLSAAVERGAVPGVLALVSNREGSIYEGSFGRRRLDEPAAMTLDTVCWIASMTKAITAAAAMQLVERGRLSLEAPLADLLPQLGRLGVLTGFDGNGRPQTRPPARPITLRHLLTHTAGFGYEVWNAEIRRYVQATGMPSHTTGLNAALETALLFDPGERWNYGIGIDWVGKAIEAASGQKLGAYLQDHLLGPLGMNDTAFLIRPDMRSRLAKVHKRDENGRLVPLPQFEIVQNPQFEGGGGGLYSTIGDYARFMRMILNRGMVNGEAILRPETVALMSRNAMGDCRVVEMKSISPERSLDIEFFPGVEKSWGLSFQINESAAPTGRPAGSLSWAGLANCYFWIDPVNGIAGAYMTQMLPFADTLSLPLYLDFEAAVYRHLTR